MEFALVRIDDRLIHGQIVTAWLQTLGKCDEILICDDPTSKDKFLLQVLKMTAPPGMNIRALSVQDTISYLQDEAKQARRILMITKGPQPILQLLEGGIHFEVVNLGGMGGGPGRKNLHRSVSVSPEEIGIFQQIQSMGVKIEIKMVPSDRGVDLASLI